MGGFELLNHVWIVLPYSVALLGIGYLLSRLLRPKAKVSGTPNPIGQEAPKKAEATKRVKGKTNADQAVADSNAAPIGPAPGPKIEVFEVPIAGSELHYYKPFGPTDSVFDVWWKLQSFTSTGPITVRLSPTDDTAPIVRSAFLADGTDSQHQRNVFRGPGKRHPRARVPPHGAPSAGCRPLAFPSHAPEGSYHFFTGTLRMELKGVQVMGMTFTVRAKFEPNLGLIPKYLSHGAEYFHCEMLSGDAPGKGHSKPEKVVVGFPWSLTRLTLYSDDRRLEERCLENHQGDRR